jgi:hypothetical protein
VEEAEQEKEALIEKFELFGQHLKAQHDMAIDAIN